MNAKQPISTPSYGYDGIHASFQVTDTPFFSYDASANCFTRDSFEASSGNAANFRQFTGKERDSESGLDYFGARYYGSALGRWTSPDWSAKPQPVPYASLNDPQTLNLYAYVRNNPLANRDADGHICIFGIGNTCNLPPLPKPVPPSAPALDRNGQPVQGPAKPQAMTAQSPTPTHGVGVGVTGGGTAALGVGKAGTAATGSVTAAVFGNSDGASAGLSASGGAMATAGKTVVGAPSNQPTDSTAVGAFAGVGAGIMLTNAGDNRTLATTTTVFSGDIAFEFGASIQVAAGPDGIFAASVTVGPGFGLAFTKIDTATAATGNQ